MSDINPSATTAAQDSRTSIRLEAGLTAPDFTLPSDNGDSVTLSALRGQNIILYFYPAAMTPGCTTEAVSYTHLDVYKRQALACAPECGCTLAYSAPNRLLARSRAMVSILSTCSQPP